MVLGDKTRYSTSCHFTEDSGRLHAPAALLPCKKKSGWFPAPI